MTDFKAQQIAEIKKFLDENVFSYEFTIEFTETHPDYFKFLVLFSKPNKKAPISNNVLKVEFFTKESIGKQLNIEWKFENESLKHKASYGIVHYQFESWLNRLRAMKDQNRAKLLLTTRYEDTRLTQEPAGLDHDEENEDTNELFKTKQTQKLASLLKDNMDSTMGPDYLDEHSMTDLLFIQLNDFFQEIFSTESLHFYKWNQKFDMQDLPEGVLYPPLVECDSQEDQLWAMAKMYQKAWEARRMEAEEAKEAVQFSWVEGLLKFFKDETELVNTKMFQDLFIGNLDMDNANIEKKEE